MQVNPVKSVSKVKAPSKVSSRSKAGNSFASSLDAVDSLPASHTTVDEVSISSIAGLLMMQGARSDEEVQEDNLKTAYQVMANLSNLTSSILRRDANEKIQSLLTIDVKTRERSSNIALEEVVDEIELRMLIEQAKVGKKR